jgi:tetratricopeptide (TPR) repeat protein
MSARSVAVILCLIALCAAPVQSQSRVIELNDAAWKALRDGYPKRAADAFAEALTLRPDDPVLLMGAGAAAHAQGNQKEAMAALRHALTVKPDLTPASTLLGQIAFDEGDVELAIHTYENALKYAPGETALTSTLNQWRKDAETHHSFNELRYERFRVLFEGHDERELAVEATNIFNSAFFRIAGTLGEYPQDTIVAVLYTEQQFRDLTRAPSWSGGQYDGRIRIPVAGALQQSALFEKVLTHELVHAIIAGIAPRGVPAWLNEGLAQYFDGTDPSPARRRMKALGRSIPLERLEAPFGNLNAAAAQVAYDESLLAVSTIADKPGFSWIRLLHQLRDSNSAADTMRSFFVPYEDLEASVMK